MLECEWRVLWRERSDGCSSRPSGTTGSWPRSHAVRAAGDGNWSYAVEMAAIALVAAAIVVGAAFNAARATTRTR